MARSFPGSQLTSSRSPASWARSAPGSLTRVAIGAGEGLASAAGLAFGLTHRPR